MGKAVDDKVLSDIATLSEQIDLCTEMLREEGKIDSNNDALLGVIGFLEACVPRMVELVEAAAQGILNESTLETCLSVNDRLLNVLSDCEKDGSSKQETSTPSVAVAAAKRSSDIDLDDLLLESSIDDLKISSKPAAGKFEGSVKNDPFGADTDILEPTPLKSSEHAEDEFDLFLKDRSKKTE